MIDKSVKIGTGAVIKGDVTIAEQSSVWYNAVIRADCNSVVIGKRTNIQDNCTIHVSINSSVTIGDDVTIGHGAIVHGCTIGNNTLIGMGSIILDDAVIGNNCIIGAGALVTGNTTIPDGMLAIGSPARVCKKLTEEDLAKISASAAHYVKQAGEDL